MMLDYRAVMVSDCNAARFPEDHSAGLTTFFQSFGDVYTAEEGTEVLKREEIGGIDVTDSPEWLESQYWSDVMAVRPHERIAKQVETSKKTIEDREWGPNLPYGIHKRQRMDLFHRAAKPSAPCWCSFTAATGRWEIRRNGRFLRTNGTLEALPTPALVIAWLTMRLLKISLTTSRAHCRVST